MQKGIIPEINKLKNAIDMFRPGRALYIKGKYQGPPIDGSYVNLLTSTRQTIRSLITRFSKVMGSNDFTKERMAVQIDAIWSYMIMDIYLTDHRGQEQTITAQLGQARGKIRSIINQVITQANTDRRIDYNTAQKLLQIHYGLKHFDKSLNPLMCKQFSSDVLKEARQTVERGRPKNNEQSTAEYTINRTVQDTIATFSSPFSLLEANHARARALQGQLHSNTGLELDLPFNENISIETNGPHHYLNRAAEEPVDYFKKCCLHEAGVALITVNASSDQSPEDLEKIAKQYGLLMSTNVLHRFVTERNELYNKLTEIRKEIKYCVEYHQSPFVGEASKEQLVGIIRQLHQQAVNISDFLRQPDMQNIFNRSIDPSDVMYTTLKDKCESVEFQTREISELENSIRDRHESEAVTKFNEFKKFLHQEGEYDYLGVIEILERLYPVISMGVYSRSTLDAFDKAKAEYDQLFKQKYSNKGKTACGNYFSCIIEQAKDRAKIDSRIIHKNKAYSEIESTIEQALQPTWVQMGELIKQSDHLLDQKKPMIGAIQVERRQARERERERQAQELLNTRSRHDKRRRKPDNRSMSSKERRCAGALNSYDHHVAQRRGAPLAVNYDSGQFRQSSVSRSSSRYK